MGGLVSATVGTGPAGAASGEGTAAAVVRGGAACPARARRAPARRELVSLARASWSWRWTTACALLRTASRRKRRRWPSLSGGGTSNCESADGFGEPAVVGTGGRGNRVSRRNSAGELAMSEVGTRGSSGKRVLVAARFRGCREAGSLSFGGTGRVLEFAHAGGQATATFIEREGPPHCRGGIATEPPSA